MHGLRMVTNNPIIASICGSASGMAPKVLHLRVDNVFQRRTCLGMTRTCLFAAPQYANYCNAETKVVRLLLPDAQYDHQPVTWYTIGANYLHILSHILLS